MKHVVTIVVSIVVFGLIIAIHELGHFLAAKTFSVSVDEFALGMGPAIYKREKNGTLYTLRLFPIGGYVKMQGEDPEEEDIRSDDPGKFYNKPCWQRGIILAAGAGMNLLLGLIVCLVMTLSMAAIPDTTVVEFGENALSAQTGLQVGDTFRTIGNVRIYTDRDVVTQLLSDEDGVYEMVVRRNGTDVPLSGVKLASNDGTLVLDFKVSAQRKRVGNVLSYTGRSFVSITRSIWLSLGDLLSGKVGFSQLSGPVGVGAVIGQAVSAGIGTFLYIAAFITINIGIFNLLPIPALDGGRLIFVLLEMIFRKPVAAKYEGMVHFVGLVLLLGLMVVVTAKDIMKLFA